LPQAVLENFGVLNSLDLGSPPFGIATATARAALDRYQEVHSS
jgi:hypothetical protein